MNLKQSKTPIRIRFMQPERVSPFLPGARKSPSYRKASDRIAALYFAVIYL
jgi:hypothetical protein